MVSKLYQSIYWTDTIFKIKTRIKSIQKILAVFQYPHLIEAITRIYFLPYGFLWSFVIQYKLEKSSCSLLSRVFNDEINDLWSAKYSSLS